MLSRIGVVALNTYREAVRARVLHGLFALAVGTALYAIVLGEFALRSALRALSDIGAASISLYGVVVAVVLAATSLYREIELKTIFPILARPIHRWEYLVGKYSGIVLTMFVFIVADAGAVLFSLAYLAGYPLVRVVGAALGTVAVAVLFAWRVPRWRSFLPIPWAIALVVLGWLFSVGAPDDRRVVVGSALLTVLEVGVVTAIAMVFASFSSPFLTAVFTFGVFIVGRSADSLARLPARVFGSAVKAMGEALSKVVPNLMLYVPPRPLLTGEAGGVPFGPYAWSAAGYALAWCVGLLAFASLVFRRRDFL